MKFKSDVETVYTSDFWYDLFDGGYIHPEDFLEDEDAKKVKAAVDLVRQFQTELEDNDLVEYG